LQRDRELLPPWLLPLGGYQRVTEVLAVIKEMGGVKKFRDLAEAMTATETDTGSRSHSVRV